VGIKLGPQHSPKLFAMRYAESCSWLWPNNTYLDSMNSSSNLRVYDSQNRFRFVTLAGPDKKEQIVPLEAARKVQLSFSILYLILISSS
jgi:hypothetical protein